MTVIRGHAPPARNAAPPGPPARQTVSGALPTLRQDARNLDVRFKLDRVGPLRPGKAAEVEIIFLDREFCKTSLEARQRISTEGSFDHRKWND